jgi:type II secretory pathway predicted ATPase ExeA
MSRTGIPTLAESRQAVVARLAYAVEQPGAVALLCGPPGVGKTLVLAALAESAPLRPRTPVIRPLVGWLDGSEAGPLPEVVLADDAHAADAADLARLVDRCHSRRPAAGLVLAGEGRLLSLVSRDARLERAVRLRAALRPFTLAETRGLLDAMLFAAAAAGTRGEPRDATARTIHEIAAGIPAAVERLADLAGVIAESRPGRDLAAADIEAIHRRLSLSAA